SQLDPPARVRAIDGSVVDAERAAVLDLPWLAAVWPAGRLVAVSSEDRLGADRVPAPVGVAGGGTPLAEGPVSRAWAARRLAELLDVPLLSELVSARLPDGEYVDWSELTAV